jgi:Outer membrane efflux protein/Thiamine pyrophosphate enzyme, C-terminal TPP binding domain
MLGGRKNHYISASSNRFIAVDIEKPTIDFLALARSMGVPGRRIEKATDIAPAIEAAIASGQTNLIEIVIGRLADLYDVSLPHYVAVHFTAAITGAGCSSISNKTLEFGSGGSVRATARSVPQPKYSLDANQTYTLAKLVDLAESHNPETRLAWQNAKAEAATVGVAKAALFPTVAAVALASTSQTGTLIGRKFHRQTVGMFQPTLNLNYLIFDFGGRSGAIAERKQICLRRTSCSMTPTERSSIK